MTELNIEHIGQAPLIHLTLHAGDILELYYLRLE